MKKKDGNSEELIKKIIERHLLRSKSAKLYKCNKEGVKTTFEPIFKSYEEVRDE